MRERADECARGVGRTEGMGRGLGGDEGRRDRRLRAAKQYGWSAAWSGPECRTEPGATGGAQALARLARQTDCRPTGQQEHANWCLLN